MSVITRVPLETDSGICIMICDGDPNSLGIKAPVGSLILDRQGSGLWVSNSSTASDWSAASGGGSSGGGGGAVQDDAPLAYAAATPSAYDDDFEGTALDAKWTLNPVVTANTLDVSVGNGRVIIAPSNYAASGKRFYGIGQVETGGSSFKIWAKLASYPGGTDAYNGLFVGDSAGKGHIFGVGFNASSMLANMGATTYGEGGSDWSAYDGYNNVNAGPLSAASRYYANWYRIRWDAPGTTLYFDYSLDEDHWINMWSRGGMTQPDRIGLGMYAQSAPASWASPMDLRARCFRYEANATF